MSTVNSSKVGGMTSSLEIDWLRVTAIVLAVAGLLVAGYMSWAELTGNETICADTGTIDCTAVQESAYASTLGFPVAMLGFLGYAAILGVLVLEDQVNYLAAYGRTFVVAMALFGVMFQTYLTYVEAAVLEKWCQWCVASFIIITALLVIGSVRLNAFLKPLRD